MKDVLSSFVERTPTNENGERGDKSQRNMRYNTDLAKITSNCLSVSVSVLSLCLRLPESEHE